MFACWMEWMVSAGDLLIFSKYLCFLFNFTKSRRVVISKYFSNSVDNSELK